MDNRNQDFIRSLFLNIFFIFVAEGISRIIDKNKRNNYINNY